MAIETRISEAEYQEIVRSHPDQQWELHDGRLREKPGVTWEHGIIAVWLSHLLLGQLDRRQFQIAINDWRVRRSLGSVYIPDLVVVPTAYGQPFAGQPGKLTIFSEPLPLVVEVWSASTGEYDVDTKIPEYRQRGDLEIWRIHPYDKTVTAWVRQPDGNYTETTHHEGVIRPVALPGVAIDLAALFEG